MNKSKTAKLGVAQAKERLLERWAEDAFQLFRRVGGTPTELSGDVASTVGRKAARLGMNEKELSSWLQKTYGSVWVRQTNLNPGMDSKDVRRMAIASYKDAQQREIITMLGKREGGSSCEF